MLQRLLPVAVAPAVAVVEPAAELFSRALSPPTFDHVLLVSLPALSLGLA